MAGRLLGLVFVFGACLLTITALWPDHAVVLDWDEVDYVAAAQLGILANALEIGSLSGPEFVKFGLAKLRHQRVSLPHWYDEQKDPWVLRHYHPPLVVFVLSPFAASHDERTLRWVQLLGACLLVTTMIGFYWVMAGTLDLWSLVMISLFAIWLSRVAFASVNLHGWVAIWAITISVLLHLLSHPGWRSRRRLLGICLCGCLALALATAEMSVVLWIGVAIWLVAQGQIISKLRDDVSRRGVGVSESVNGLTRRSVMVGLCFTAFLVLVVWPGSAVKMSLIKDAAMVAYRLWLGYEYADVSWGRIIRDLLPIAVLAPPSLFWLVSRERSQKSQWGPAALLAFLYLLAMVPFAITARYLVPTAALLACLITVACSRFPARWGKGATVLLACGLMSVVWPHTSAGWGRLVKADLQWFAEKLGKDEALVEGGHIYRHYLDGHYRIVSVVVEYGGGALLLREGGMYNRVNTRDLAGRLIALRARTPETRISGELKGVFSACAYTERASIRVYDCRQLELGRSG